jgi:hypothetical protein
MFVLIPVLCVVLFLVGEIAGRWTAPTWIHDQPSLHGETWSEHVSRIVSASQGLRDQEYQANVKVLQQYKDRHPEYTHLVDDQLRLLHENHESRAKAVRDLPHPEMKVE